MDIKKFAEAQNVSEMTVRRWIKSGKVQAELIGGKYTFPDITLAKEVQTLPPNKLEVRSFDWFQNHPARGLTPELVAMYLEMAEQGDICYLADLYDDIEERDPFIYSLAQTRKKALLSKQWDILPYDESSKAKKQAEFIKESFERLSDNELVTAGASEYMSFRDLLSYALDATGRGFSVAGIDWDTSDKWVPRAAYKIHQRHFRIGKHGDKENYNPYQIRLITDADPLGEPLPPYHYLTHFNTDRGAYLTRSGLLRPSLWYYLFKHHSVKWLVRFVELFATPFRTGKYDPNSSTWENDITALKNGLAQMGAAGYAIIPKDAEIGFLDAARSSSQGNPQMQSLEYYDKALTTLWLGQTGTTMQTPGKLGNSDEQENVRFDLMESDAESLIATIQRSLVVPIARFNDGECLCYFTINYKPEEDQQRIVDVLVKAAEIVPIPNSYIYERLDIPEPSEGEKTTTPGGNPFQFSKKKVRLARMRTDRLQRDARIRDAQEGLVQDGIKELTVLYDNLLEGVTRENYDTKIAANKRKFFLDFEKLAFEKLTGLDKVFDTEYGRQVNNQLAISWNLADMTAMDFFNWQSFTMAKLEGELVTQAMTTGIKDILGSGLEQGTIFRDVLQTVKESYGIDAVKDHHMQLVWRNNMTTAHSAAVLDRLNKGDFGGWQFIAIDDAGTTDICLERNNNIYPASNRGEMPPLHHNCRSEASPVTQEEMEAEGYETDIPDVEPADSGFKNFAVANYNNWVKSTTSGLPSDVRTSVEREIQTKLNEIKK